MRWVAIVALATMAGCNLVFGLDPPAGDDDGGGDVDADTRPDGPPGDRDSDGIGDFVDNCPADANTDQHDEDEDATGDVCDNCPHMANEGQSDAADGDGVGDICDPNRRPGGDRLLLFEPFSTLGSRWTPALGTWAPSSDSVVGGQSGGTHLLASVDTYEHAQVVASVRFLAVQTAGQLGVYFALDRTNPSIPFGYLCLIQYTPLTSTTGDGRAQVNKFLAAGGATVLVDLGVPALTLGDTYTIVANASADEQNCVLALPNLTVPMRALDGEYRRGAVGIRARDATVAVDWLVIYE